MNKCIVLLSCIVGAFCRHEKLQAAGRGSEVNRRQGRQPSARCQSTRRSVSLPSPVNTQPVQQDLSTSMRTKMYDYVSLIYTTC